MADFLHACSVGDPERVAALAAAGCDTAVTNNAGLTGLIMAALSDFHSGCGSVATLGGVLDAGGADLEAKDKCGGTAFLIACDQGDPESAAALIEAGCDTAATISAGQTGLIAAAAALSGSVATVQAVLDAGGADRESKEAREGCTAFLFACVKGTPEIVTSLIEAGCDTAVTGSNGATGLMLAAACGSVTTVGAVLDAGGADLEAKEGNDHTAFLYACAKGDVEIVTSLIEAGCETAVTTSDGRTGLALAAASGSAATLGGVLEAGGADLEAKEATAGRTAFLMACVKRDPESAAALIEAGCDTAATTSAGQTGLMMAVSSDSLATVQALLDAGGLDLEVRDTDGSTVFLRACWSAPQRLSRRWLPRGVTQPLRTAPAGRG